MMPRRQSQTVLKDSYGFVVRSPPAGPAALYVQLPTNVMPEVHAPATSNGQLHSLPCCAAGHLTVFCVLVPVPQASPRVVATLL